MLKMMGTILKIAAIILVVFSLPFIIPIFFKLLIHLKVFDNINEIKDIINVFNNKYTLIYISIGIIVIII